MVVADAVVVADASSTAGHIPRSGEIHLRNHDYAPVSRCSIAGRNSDSPVKIGLRVRQGRRRMLNNGVKKLSGFYGETDTRKHRG